MTSAVKLDIKYEHNVTIYSYTQISYFKSSKVYYLTSFSIK